MCICAVGCSIAQKDAKGRFTLFFLSHICSPASFARFTSCSRYSSKLLRSIALYGAIISGISSGETLSMIAIIRFPSTQAAPISIKTQGRSIEYRLRRTINSLHSCIFFRIDSEIDSLVYLFHQEMSCPRIFGPFLQSYWPSVWQSNDPLMNDL